MERAVAAGQKLSGSFKYYHQLQAGASGRADSLAESVVVDDDARRFNKDVDHGTDDIAIVDDADGVETRRRSDPMATEARGCTTSTTASQR